MGKRRTELLNALSLIITFLLCILSVPLGVDPWLSFIIPLFFKFPILMPDGEMLLRVSWVIWFMTSLKDRLVVMWVSWRWCVVVDFVQPSVPFWGNLASGHTPFPPIDELDPSSWHGGVVGIVSVDIFVVSISMYVCSDEFRVATNTIVIMDVPVLHCFPAFNCTDETFRLPNFIKLAGEYRIDSPSKHWKNGKSL